MSINLRELLSKDHITSLYKLVISKDSNIKTKEKKEKILQILMNTMKKTYKSLEKGKINESNFKSIKNQFNNICITETLNIYNKKESVKNNINLQERPKTQSRHIDDSLKNNRLDNLFNNNLLQDNISSFDNFTPDKNNYLERPKMLSGNEITSDTSMQDRLNQLESSRKQLNPNNIPKDIPDFLKPTKVGKQKEEFSRPSPPNNNNQNLNNIENNELGGFSSSNNIQFENFSTIENIQIDDSKFNDNISLSDRLAKLEMERGQQSNPVPQNELPKNNLPPNSMPSYDPTPSVQQPPPNSMSSYDPTPPVQQPLQNSMPSYDPTPPVQQPLQNSMPSYDPTPPVQQMNNNLENTLAKLNEELNLLKKEIMLLKNNNSSLKSQPSQPSQPTNIIKRELQLEIDKKESKYKYNFNQLDNVIGIKLLSYSLPYPIYNVNNSVIKYIFDDSINKYQKEIVIEEGFYKIENLLERLNRNDDIIFTLNIQRKVEVRLKIPELKNNSELIPNKKFKLLKNSLLKNLGFKNLDEKFTSFVNSNYNFDLRLPNKLFLHILNLEKERPFGILNFNGTSSCHLNFKNPISINNLELIFLDENKNLYNFNELSYNLSFQITVLENSQENLAY